MGALNQIHNWNVVSSVYSNRDSSHFCDDRRGKLNFHKSEDWMGDDIPDHNHLRRVSGVRHLRVGPSWLQEV